MIIFIDFVMIFIVFCYLLFLLVILSLCNVRICCGFNDFCLLVLNVLLIMVCMFWLLFLVYLFRYLLISFLVRDSFGLSLICFCVWIFMCKVLLNECNCVLFFLLFKLILCFCVKSFIKLLVLVINECLNLVNFFCILSVFV